MLCACNTVQLLQRAISTSFLLSHALQFKRLLKTYLFGDWDRGALWHLLGAPCINCLTYKSPNALVTRFIESYSNVSISESKRLKKSSSNWLNTGNALIQRVKNIIFVFPALPGSAEAQVIWGGIIKCLLIVYFVSNISAKYIKIRSRLSKFAKGETFLRHSVELLGYYAVLIAWCSIQSFSQ